ncbi:MAG TPA: hypothetical protein VFG68_17865 [Fimbriiglobus sp.]|nr:hypothetical protein [Fimbriiglobus sp.]
MSTVTMDVRELPGRLSELMALVRAGTEVVLEEASAPVAKLVPCEKPRREFILGMHPGAMVMREDFDDPIDEEDFLKGNI